MRMLSFVALGSILFAAPVSATPLSFSSQIAPLRARELHARKGFAAVAAVDYGDKGRALAPHAEAMAQIVSRLQELTPPSSFAACHADALEGARRAQAAMGDMLRIYREHVSADADIAPVLVSAAQDASTGLTQLAAALSQCDSTN